MCGGVAFWQVQAENVSLAASKCEFRLVFEEKHIKGQEALELNSPHSPNEGFQKQVASWGMKPMQSQHLLTKRHIILRRVLAKQVQMTKLK